MFDRELMKKRRKELKITQKDLADLVGVSQVSISGYESGENEPKHDTRRKIAEALHLSLGELSGENQYTEEGKPKTYWEAIDQATAFERYLEGLGYTVKMVENFEDVEYIEEDGTTTVEKELESTEYIIEKGDLLPVTLSEKEMKRISTASRKNIEFLLWEIYNDQWK